MSFSFDCEHLAVTYRTGVMAVYKFAFVRHQEARGEGREGEKERRKKTMVARNGQIWLREMAKW